MRLRNVEAMTRVKIEQRLTQIGSGVERSKKMVGVLNSTSIYFLVWPNEADIF